MTLVDGGRRALWPSLLATPRGPDARARALYLRIAWIYSTTNAELDHSRALVTEGIRARLPPNYAVEDICASASRTTRL
eukprot:6733438-Pyramimonas_sp.AAC.1